MEAYKPYIDFMTNGGVAETVYMLSRQGAICGTNLPIQAMPQYNFDLVDGQDPDKTTKVVVDERVNLLEAIDGKGVCKNPAGIRLYNQKYYAVRYDEDSSTLYLKKEQGGACIALTKNFILIGTFSSLQKMQNGVPQNPGQLNKRIQTLAKDLLSKGS